MFFGPDDLIHLEQASGLIPASTSPLRFLSQVAYFRAVLAFSGPYAPTFHLLSLLLHLTNVVLVGLLARGLGLSRPASSLAAGLFGLHPLVTPSLMFAVNINELMALAGFLIALRLARARSRIATVITPLAMFGALFCKESVLLLPALTPALLRPPNETGILRARWLLLVGPALAFALLLVVLASRGLVPRGDAYDLSFGPVTVANIGTYLRWILDLSHPVPDVVGAPDIRAWPIAVVAALVYGVARHWLPDARHALDVGAGWFVLGGLPTFVLTHHSYAAYLYVPGVGLALALAAMSEGVVRRLASRWAESRTASSILSSASAKLLPATVCMLLLIAFAARSNALLEARALTRLRVVDLPFDPLARKSVIAGRAISSMASTLPPSAQSAVLFAPSSSRLQVSTLTGRPADSASRPAYDLQATALDHGRAVRLFFPRLNAVSFVSSLPAIEASCAIFSRSNEGYLGFHGMGVAGARDLATRLSAAGYSGDARSISMMLAADSAKAAETGGRGERIGVGAR